MTVENYSNFLSSMIVGNKRVRIKKELKGIKKEYLNNGK